MKGNIDVSIVVPVHNEQSLIVAFLKQLQKSCQKIGLNYEVIAVENGSKDNSWQLLYQEALSNQWLKPIQLPEAGYGLAIITGLQQAKGKYTVIFNVDFWDEKFLILTKVDMLGFDIINSSKLLPGSKDQRSFNRRAVTWLFNKFLNVFLGYKGTDTHGIKIIRLQKAKQIIDSCQTKTGIYDSELMIRAQRKGLAILELPVTVKEIRPARFSFRRVLKTPLDMIELIYHLRQ